MAGAAGRSSAWSTRSIVATMFPVLVVLSAIEIGSGLVLEAFESSMAEVRVLAVLVPVTISIGGNLGAIFSARLSTRVHLGTTEFDPRDRDLWVDAVAITALALTVFAAAALASYALGHAIGAPVGLRPLLVITLGSGLLLAAFAMTLSVVATFASFHLGVDPDDTTIPIVTNVTDVFGVVVLFLVSVRVFGL